MSRQSIVDLAIGQVGYLQGAGYDGPNKFSAFFGLPAEAWCFAAGTLITTPVGLVDISELEIGDHVLSASGADRLVEQIMTHEADNVVVIKALGLDGTITTAEHPYLTPDGWVAAGELNRGDLIAIPRPAGGNVYFGQDSAYIVGRWLADGWVTMKKSRSTGRMFPRWFVCAAGSKVDGLAKALMLAGVSGARRTYPTVEQFAIGLGPITDVLADAGAYAHGKRLPGCVMTWNTDARRAVLEGYLDGDGARSPQPGTYARASTASRQLAHGIAGLARSLGFVVSLYHYERRSNTEIIEGRRVNVRGIYEIHLRLPDARSSHVTIDDTTHWVPVRSVTPADPLVVYNLTVADEHTFIADGAAVHNCADFVTWLYATDGVPLPSMQTGHVTGYSWVPSAVAYAQAHGCGRPSWLAEPGDPFAFDWNGDGVADHTGVMVGKSGSRVEIVSGNSGPAGGVNRSFWDCPDGVGNNLVLLTVNADQLVNFGATPVPAPGPIVVNPRPGSSWPGRILVLKSPDLTGPDVLAWQSQMNVVGYGLVVDGDYGPISSAACTAFQMVAGLVVDGQVGPITWDAVMAALPNTAPIVIPAPPPAPPVPPVVTGTPARMYDGVAWQGIPATAPVVAGYTNHRWVWPDAAWSRFAGLWLPIATYVPGAGDDPRQVARDCAATARRIGLPVGVSLALDVEAGDAQRAHDEGFTAAWADEVAKGGDFPVDYTSKSTQPIIAGDGFVDHWGAEYNGAEHINAGDAATQWASPSTGSGGQWDLSLTNGLFPRRPGGLPVPLPNPPVPPPVLPPTTAPDHNPFTLLVVDGDFGNNSIHACQWKIGAQPDGVFGHLSDLALQVHLGVAQDGVIGPVTVRALQTRCGLTGNDVDGQWGPVTTEALQRALNQGTF